METQTHSALILSGRCSEDSETSQACWGLQKPHVVLKGSEERAGSHSNRIRPPCAPYITYGTAKPLISGKVRLGKVGTSPASVGLGLWAVLPPLPHSLSFIWRKLWACWVQDLMVPPTDMGARCGAKTSTFLVWGEFPAISDPRGLPDIPQSAVCHPCLQLTWEN